MKIVTLTQIEATGIQEYIFGSNNLRQNVGASELVARATSEWVAATLKKLNLPANVEWDESKCELKFLKDRSIAGGNIRAEVIYAGGGNALILFEGAKDGIAKEFTRQLTRLVLERARGLALVVGHAEFDGDVVALSAQHAKLREDMQKWKMERAPDVPLPGLGVTAKCNFTGLPAIGRDPEERLISQVVRHKLDGYDSARTRLHSILPRVRSMFDDFVTDFDRFGEKGESSYIAVVHTDGNRMGERFQAIAKAYPSPQDNAAYAKQLRVLSRAVNQQAMEALRATVDLLMRSCGGKRYLPFRPIVFGGDDVTFVCDGRHGLALAAKYLQTLAAEKLPGACEGEMGDPLYARAGVAVVKSHYPFSRAYDLAEELAKSAKDKLGRRTREGKGAVMDWHFATSGVVLPLKQIREREYKSAEGKSLLMRPVGFQLDGTTKDTEWRTWENFKSMMTEFQDEKGKWIGRRNKVKALRDALRQGPNAVVQFRSNYDGLPLLPEISGQTQLVRETGWLDKHCGYFDAIEALDFYEPLEGKEEKK